MKICLAAIAAAAYLFALSPSSQAASCDPSDNSGVLVMGGTGQLGSYHVKQLSASGQRVVVLARPTSTFERLEGATYEVMVGDLRIEAEVRAAILEAKPSVIIDAANVPGIRMEDGDSFYWRSVRYQIAAAKSACVTQIIRHSARNARVFLTRPPPNFGDDPRVVNYMRDLARAEIALEHGGVNYTLVLNGNLPPEPAEPTGRGTLSESLDENRGITRADLARITNTCILNTACYGRTFNGIDPG